MIPIEAILDHNTGTDTATTGPAHDNLTQFTEATATTIGLIMTHHINHIGDLPNIQALQVINPKTTVGHIHEHPTNPQGMDHVDQVHNPARQEDNHIPRI